MIVFLNNDNNCNNNCCTNTAASQARDCAKHVLPWLSGLKKMVISLKLNFIANQSIRGNVLRWCDAHLAMCMSSACLAMAMTCGHLLQRSLARPSIISEQVEKRESRNPNSNAAARHKKSLCAFLAWVLAWKKVWALTWDFLQWENWDKWVVYTCNRIKMESQAVFQAITQAKFICIELGPWFVFLS